MKKMYLLLALIFIFANQAKGAKNVGARDGLPCDSFGLTNDVTVSDCADRRLSQDASEGDGYTDQDINGKFYDKCCYMRAMLQGRYIYGCIGLERNETIDTIDYINLEEKQSSKYLRSIGLIEEGQDFKIYSIDCKASYIKYFVSVFMLFFLLF